MKCFWLGIAGIAIMNGATAQDVVLRHHLEGRALDSLATLVLRFNDEQKGKARVLLQDARGVENKAALPHLALLDPEESRDFFGTRPRFRPLHEIVREANEKIDLEKLFPQVADAVDDASGRIQALPLAMSVPVLFINRDAFRKAKLNPDAPPKTWLDVQKAADALHDAGVKCPLTSSHFAWIHLENVASQHGESVAVRGTKNDRLVGNSLVNVKHVAMLASWQKSSFFHYFGPGREADRKFVTGECAMLTGASAAWADIRREARFDAAIAALPHYDDVHGAKADAILPDGAALWAPAGHKKDEYRVIARFAAYMLRPEIQKQWVRDTTFLPMTPAAIDALREANAFPAAQLDSAQKRLSVPKKQSVRARHGAGRNALREFVGEEIVSVWTTERPAKEALDAASARANESVAPRPADRKPR